MSYNPDFHAEQRYRERIGGNLTEARKREIWREIKRAKRRHPTRKPRQLDAVRDLRATLIERWEDRGREKWKVRLDDATVYVVICLREKAIVTVLDERMATTLPRAR